jgi:hypothetical protein
MSTPLRVILIPLLSIACQPRFTTSEAEEFSDSDVVEDNVDEDEDETEDWSAWEGAELIVHSPESGSLLWLGEDTDFEAELIAVDGSSLEWSEVAWTTSIDDDWTGSGLEFEDDDLIAGLHDLRVETTLPTGDHLVWTVGGVRVQHEHAGTYVGNMLVDATSDYDGTEYTTTCIGAAIIAVNAEGELASGDSNCLISLLGYDIDANYDFELDIDDDEIEGVAALDLVWSSVDFEATGEIEDGMLTASWADTLYDTILMEGTLELERISYEIP